MAKDMDLESGESTPLIRPLSSPSAFGVAFGNEEQDLADVKEWTSREKAVAGMSAVSFGTSAAAMVLYPHPIVYVSGFIGCTVGPYVAFQQQKITEVRTLKETNVRFQQEIDELEGEVKKTEVQVKELQSTVESLQKSKVQLERISDYQGASVAELEKQLKKTKEIHSMVASSVEDKILMNLMKLAESCDTDGSKGQLSNSEIQATIKKIESIHGISIDGEAITKMITTNGNDLYAILLVVKQLLQSDDLSKSKLFKKK